MYYCTGKLLPLIYLCKKCHLYTDTPNLQPAMSNNTCTSSIPSPIQPTSSNRTTKRKLDLCSTKNLTKRLRKKSLGLYMHVFMNYNITLVSIVDLTDNNPVILTGDGNTPWLRKNFAFTLFLSDKKSITDGKWISDAVINAGQQLLKEIFLAYNHQYFQKHYNHMKHKSHSLCKFSTSMKTIGLQCQI